MKEADLIVHARWIVPMTDQIDFLENHSLIVKDGKILDLIPTQMVSNQYSAKEIYHLNQDHLLMPGLINSHTHVNKFFFFFLLFFFFIIFFFFYYFFFFFFH